ncbi:putative Glucose sorbosone dehydrogenase [Seiridium unicorne]|uniref:Glucose sorbosone dehydrogenase n=1 Tax=Seiridium unicorne TaxID=138068 RepID=A0ABR2VCE7_9PEZI
MKAYSFLTVAGTALLHLSGATADDGSCSTVLHPSYSAPVVGTGWIAQLVVTNLTKPRSIIWDSNGHLLAVEQGVGIRRLTFNDQGSTCLNVADSSSVVDNSDLNHGIAFSNDGKTLFASTSQNVFAWAYDPGSGTISGDQRTVVQNLGGTGHVTRTLLITSNNQLLVSRGSGENIDYRAQDITTGVSQIRAFNVANLPDTPFDYASTGTRLGWGLRNSVGVAEEPTTGGIFSVENSVDQISRDGTDIHQNNPGEEMNFHGFLNGSTEHQGGNYGYPDCFALWDTNIPDIGTMEVGSQFPQGQNATLNDTTCSDERVSPRLTWQAHMAPLDIIFTPNGSTAYVTFHGSWDRDNPVGYMLSSVEFANGQPVAASDSTDSLKNIISNADNSACPDHCFRPVGLALDSQGRLFMSSDATGEIYVLAQAEVTTTGGPTTSGTPSGTLVTPSATDSGNVGSYGRILAARAYIGNGVGRGWGVWLTVMTGFATGFGLFVAFPYI